MADTLPDVPLTANTWVDLYAATGITVGTQIVASNKGSVRFTLAASATAPSDNRGITVEPNQQAINENGDTGAWAYCSSGGLVSVAEFSG